MRAMQALLRSGDKDKIIYFASKFSVHLYILSAYFVYLKTYTIQMCLGLNNRKYSSWPPTFYNPLNGETMLPF